MAYIAIDIGGTAIKAGIVSSSGELSDRTAVKTPKQSYEELMSVLCDLVRWGMDHASIEGIALSQPCATNPSSAEAISEGALIYIKNTNPARDLGRRFLLPYSAENDGNCAALAEVWLGSAKDYNNIVSVVSGTGIGGAIVKDRNIHHGDKLFAGEFGMCITGFDAKTHKPICWSENGSTQALVLNYASESGQDPSKLNGRAVFEYAELGDEVAQRCIDRFFEVFVLGIHNIQHIYDPECILVGGGISERSDFLTCLSVAMDKFYSQFDLVMSIPVVKTCAFGADANLIGAVYHHLSHRVSHPV
jgi:predicted NBD/HSP70 family sugar kinase